MKRRNPICFIAMAFGKEDTDLFYSNLILPVLKRNHIKPIIINRQQNNDDINIQIYEQIRSADFCIADLTYARPSVYFEAGFSERLNPVIYTVRKDHLKNNQPEHLRVHFDLQMKPIITWDSHTDEYFTNELEKRLQKTILREWKRKCDIEAKNQKLKDNYNNLSQIDKLISLRRTTIYALRNIGMSISKWEVCTWFLYNRYSKYSFKRKDIVFGLFNHIFAIGLSDYIRLFLSVQSYSSLNKKDLTKLHSIYSYGNFATSQFGKDDWLNTKIIYSNIIVLCLKPPSSNQIEAIFSDFKPIEKSKIYSTTNVQTIAEHPVLINSTYFFFSGFESLNQLKIMINNLIIPPIKKQMDIN